MPEDARSRGYRDRIYEHYVSAFKGALPPDQLQAAFTRQARFFDHLLGPLVRDLKPRKVLDVGCGQGSLLFWATRRGIADVRGFDRSEEQIVVARSLGLACEVATTTDYFSRCDRDFDLVTALDVVEHFNRDEALEFLAQCRSCLRPGGTFLLTTPNGAAWRPGPVIYGDLTHETIYSPDTIRLALRLTGFDDVHVREIAPGNTSLRARVRGVLWRVIRTGAMLFDVIETGRRRAVYSRVMTVVARRSPSDQPGAITTVNR